MKIRMLETRKGTEDGFVVKKFIAGEDYEVRDHLAKAFLAAGFAIPAWKANNNINYLKDRRK